MTAKPKSVRVVAGIIHREGRLLVCRRKTSGAFPLKWEFAGGKVEPGESHEKALKRELKEELGVEIQRATQIFSHRHVYPNTLEVELCFYRIDRYKGQPKNHAFHEIRWVQWDQLGELEFLEGDFPLIQRISDGAWAF